MIDLVHAAQRGVSGRGAVVEPVRPRRAGAAQVDAHHVGRDRIHRLRVPHKQAHPTLGHDGEEIYPGLRVIIIGQTYRVAIEMHFSSIALGRAILTSDSILS